MLHHMDGEQFMVQCRQRRTRSDPHDEKPHHEGREPASRERKRKAPPNMQPAAYVSESRESGSDRHRDFERRVDVMEHRHPTAAAYDPSAPALRAST